MRQNSVKVNFIMNAILTISTFVFPLITFPYISRVLMPVGTGKVSFATSLISYFLMIAQLGIPTYGIRACAKVRDDKEKLTKVAQELLIINLIMAVVSYILLALAIIFIPALKEERLLYIIVGTTIFLTSIGMEWLYQALEQYMFITIRSIAFKLIGVIAMFLLVKEPNDYVIYGAIVVVANSLYGILNFLYVRKYISLKPVGNYNFKRHLKAVLIFFALACATTIYTNLDIVMLGFMKSDVDVGYYNAAVRIKTILVGLVTALGAVLLPRLSYYIEVGKIKEFQKTARKAFNFVIIAALPLTIYFIIYAKYGVFLLSGDKYAGSIVPMQIIMPTLIFIGITNILGMEILVPLGKEKTVLWSCICGAVIDLVLNFILIPKIASSGAAIGTLTAELAVLIVQGLALKNSKESETIGGIRNMFLSVSYWKVVLGIIIGIALSFWVIFLNLGNFITLLISAVIFFGAYYAFLMITKERLTLELTEGLISAIKNRISNNRK